MAIAVKRRKFIRSIILFPCAAAMPLMAAAPFRHPAWRSGAFINPVTGGGGGACNTSKDSQGGTINNNAPNDTYLWIGWNFVAGSTYTLCKIDVRVTKNGTPPAGNATVAIYTNNSGEPGTQVGTGSDGVDVSTIGTDTDFNHTFSNLSASLTNGTTYWVVLKTPGPPSGSDDELRLHYSFTGVATHLVKLNDGMGGTWDSWTTHNQGIFISYSA